MSESPNMSLREIVKKIYGHQINYFARGSPDLEKHAINVSVPAIAAVTLSEEFASIVLTSRIDNELQKFLLRAFHRQGDAEELLFDVNMPFGTLSAKIAAAYSFGILTKKMYDALTSCRKIRNAYAHSDNPDDAKISKDYTKHAPRLLNLDPLHTADCIAKLRDLRTRATEVVNVVAECSDVIAVMLGICDTLGSAAFFALAVEDEKVRVIPAPFGGQDMLEVTDKRLCGDMKSD